MAGPSAQLYNLPAFSDASALAAGVLGGGLGADDSQVLEAVLEANGLGDFADAMALARGGSAPGPDDEATRLLIALSERDAGAINLVLQSLKGWKAPSLYGSHADMRRMAAKALAGAGDGRSGAALAIDPNGGVHTGRPPSRSRRPDHAAAAHSPAASAAGRAAASLEFGGQLVFIPHIRPVRPEDMPREGVLRYIGLAPELRTYFTDQMIRVEHALRQLLSIQPEDVTPEIQRDLPIDALSDLVEDAFVDLKELLTEHGTLHYMLINTAQTIIMGGEDVTFNRVHINMTTINEMDPTGRLGNIYLEIVTGWLQEKFGRVSVIQNPERTTFVFLGSPGRHVSSVMSSFEREISYRLRTAGVARFVIGRFRPTAFVSQRTLTAGNLFSYAIRTADDIETFRLILEPLGMDMAVLKAMPIERALKVVSARPPDIDGIIRSGSRPHILSLYALITKAMIGVQAALAAQTEYFEKTNGSAASSDGAITGEHHLPGRDTAQFATWLGFLNRLAGYVGPGLYNPAQYFPELGDPAFTEGTFLDVGMQRMEGGDEKTFDFKDHPGVPQGVNDILRAVPPVNRLLGSISFTRKGTEGGLIERFVARLNEFRVVAPAGRDTALWGLQYATLALLNGLRNLYRWAIRERKNTFTLKQLEAFDVRRGSKTETVRANFFMQEVAKKGNRHLAALEYDSFKAYSATHNRFDIDDKDFNTVRSAVWLAAKRLDMPMPIVNPVGGDHILISFSDRKIDGREVDPVGFCRVVQSIVYNMFKDLPFQDLHKVDVYEYELAAADIPELKRKGFMEDMRQALNLRAQPYMSGGGDGYTTLMVPEKDAVGNDVTDVEVGNYLWSRGITAKAKKTVAEKARLPIWKRSDKKSVTADDLVFAKERPQGPYQPFFNTLTVTMALAEHAPLVSAPDIQQFRYAVEVLDIHLDIAKQASWPEKQGFIDARESK